MPFNKSILFSSFFASFLIGLFINLYNISSIKELNPQNDTIYSARSLKYNKTILSIDDYWYINHIKNYDAGKGFTYNPETPLNSVRRTPVYPLFYGMHYVLFGEEGSYSIIRWTQLFLYAISTVFLLLAAYNFTNKKKIAWFTYFLYLLNFPLTGFVFYTITEALYPSLLCFLLFFISKYKHNLSNKTLYISGIIFALCSLTRPSIIFIFIPILLTLVLYNNFKFKNSLLSWMIFIAGAATLFLPWMVRNYMVTKGDIVILEKYYGGDQMDYGMPNMHLKYWIASWANPGDVSSEAMSNLIIRRIVYQDSTQTAQVVDSIVNTLPPLAFIGNSKEQVHTAFSSLFSFYIASKKGGYSKEITMKREQIASNYFIQLKSNFAKQPEGKLNIYLFTPFRYIKSLVFQSNASSLAFFDNYSGNYLKIAIKAILLLINVFSFASIFIILFWYNNYKDIFWLSFLFSGLTFFIIMVVNKNFEARYLFPLMPLLYMNLSAVVVELFTLLKKNYTSK